MLVTSQPCPVNQSVDLGALLDEPQVGDIGCVVRDACFLPQLPHPFPAAGQVLRIEEPGAESLDGDPAALALRSVMRSNNRS